MMTQDTKPEKPLETLEKRLTSLKAEIFDCIKSIDIAEMTKRNRLKELQELEDKIDRMKKNGANVK